MGLLTPLNSTTPLLSDKDRLISQYSIETPVKTDQSQCWVKVGISACVVLPFFFLAGAELIAHDHPFLGSVCIITGAAGELIVAKIFKNACFQG